MKRIKALVVSTAVSGIFFFIINIIFFATLGDIYSSNMHGLIVEQKPFLLGLKTAGASLIAAFVLALAYDLAYAALPGGVFRKTINFGTMAFAVISGVWLPLLYAVSGAEGKFYVALSAQCIIICFAGAAVMSGIYHEYTQRQERAASADKPAAEENEHEEDHTG